MNILNEMLRARNVPFKITYEGKLFDVCPVRLRVKSKVNNNPKNQPYSQSCGTNLILKQIGLGLRLVL